MPPELSVVRDGTAMLTVTGAGPAGLPLARDEAILLEDLRNNLPEGWGVELQADAGMTWVALVYQAGVPSRRPMFTICRWNDRVGLLVQWTDGSAYSAMASIELRPILDLIANGIFAFTEACLTTMPTEGWVTTRH